MKRRNFLQQVGPAVAGATAAAAVLGTNAGCASDTSDTANQGSAGGESGAPSVQTNKTIRWRLSSSFPSQLDTIYGASEVFAERVNALSEGRFQIRVYEAGELVPGLQVLDAVQQGTVQVGQTASYYFTGKNPALAFDCCVPFGMTARQQAAWLHEGGGLDLMNELFADFNILSFPGGNTGAQMGGWFKREISGVADLKGLKMRIPGIGGEVMSRLGAIAQVISGGEIYPALERGAIDATEWVGPYDDEKLGFYKVAKFYYYPGWWEPGPSLSFYVNRDAWNELPAAYKEIVRSAAKDAELAMQARYDQKNPGALKRLLENGVQLRKFSDDVLESARTTALEMYEQSAAADPAYRKVYESWKKARGEAFGWFDLAERAYADFAFGRG